MSKSMVVLLLLCIGYVRSEVTVQTVVAPSPNCKPYKSILSDVMVTVSASFFADHPREGSEPLDPKNIKPFTPDGLFWAYYGNGSTAEEFKRAILEMAYVKFERLKNEDRIIVRQNIALYGSSGSFDLARERLASLLYAVTGDYSHGSSEWMSDSCLPVDQVESAEVGIAIEFASLRNEIGDDAFSSLLAINSGKTLAFVIDSTGSMGNEIHAARNRVKIITDFVQNSLDRPQEYVLVPFNDPEVGPLTVTKDAKEFKNALDRVSASGGGDQPEMCMRGIQLAVENCRAGSTIYVITDVHAKDYAIQDTVIAQARRKNIQIVFMLTNGLEYCRHTSDKRYLGCKQLYLRIAVETGGKVLIVSKSSLFRATEIVQSNLKQGYGVLRKVSIKTSTEAKKIYFDVDSGVDEVSVEAVGGCDSPVLVTHEDQTTEFWSVGDLYSVTKRVNGVFGRWHIALGASSNCDITISGRSRFGFLMNAFVKSSGNGSAVFQKLNGLPSASDHVMLTVDGFGQKQENGSDATDRVESVELWSESGLKAMQSVPVTPGDDPLDLSYVIHLTQLPPPFYVVVKGLDRNGFPFTRVIPQLMRTSHIKMTCDADDVGFKPGVSTRAHVSIENNGGNDTFLFTVIDKRHFARLVGASQRKITAGSTQRVGMDLTPKAKTKDGTASEITFTVKGKHPGSFQYVTCTAIVRSVRPRIDSLSIKGKINARYVETVVTSVITNDANFAREAEFDVILPSDAFIIGITMKLHNETIVGKVEEKKKAKKIYDKAKKTGKGAGHVAVRDKSTRIYKTSMFVEPRRNVSFQLTYQQLLRRTGGKYEYVVAITPLQPVKRLSVDVHIVEDDPIMFVRVPPFKTRQTNVVGPDQPPAGTTITFNSDRKSAHVRFLPSITQQTEFSPLGLSGSYIVQYDVQRSQMHGQVIASNGYFAHFFAPVSLAPLPKIVVFVIDKSGSMYGHKMAQTKKAFTSIMRNLNRDDYFNIIAFDGYTDPWIHEVMSPATPSSVENAVTYIEGIYASGGTNIMGAMESAFHLMKPFMGTKGNETENVLHDTSRRIRKREADMGEQLHDHTKMIIFMTDGQPSVGETNVKMIEERISSLNKNRVRIHTIGFGAYVDMGFLARVAAGNGGASRRIFESLDADTQMYGFLNEVTSPVMTDIVFDYPMDRVKDLTLNPYSVLSSGSEMVVAGRFDFEKELDGSGSDEAEVFELEKSHDIQKRATLVEMLSAQVRGNTFEGDWELDFDIDPNKVSRIDNSIHQIENFTERMWAFLQVKGILREAIIAEDDVKPALFERALNMSLKYNFVTPLTSLLVIRPKDRRKIENQLRKEEEERKEKEALAEKLRLEAKKRRKNARSRHRGTRIRVSSSSSLSSRSGGFYGDPHFVVPLAGKRKLCFNWDGKDGEIYNLFYDRVDHVLVNGQLVVRKIPDFKKPRSYISILSIVIPDKKLRFVVDPHNVTILSQDGERHVTLSVTSPMNFVRHGVRIQFYDVVHTSAKISIVTKGLTFHIKLVRNKQGSNSIDHLDFTVDSRHTGPNLHGVIGQFLNAEANIVGDPKGDGYLVIGERFGAVTMTTRKHPVSGHELSCWMSYGNAKDLIRGEHQHYLVNEIWAEPDFSFL
uniref:Inter-alpha-trypsin inhibitor heavy chain H3 n=1 Tax=Phallusia mammillata TaxID=59560 RepID=A0A6F9DEQ4_9ASCI|nr:inter-alpha-trypsin inhibitor heavy chain H3 [Phallusia mammillata]